MFKRSCPLPQCNLVRYLTQIIIPLSRVDDVGNIMAHLRSRSLPRRLQLIIREGDLETPFRCLGACMPQWQVLRVRRKVYIIGLRSNDSVGVRHQLIDSHATDCTYSTLRTIVIIGGTSRVC
jgi:hypothetical protein